VDGQINSLEFTNLNYYQLSMEKKRYLAPFVREISSLDMECQILGVSVDQKNVVKVDPVEEHYYDGTVETSDHLVTF
jgi:hypothetical protein